MRVFLPAFVALASAPAVLPAQQMVQALPGTTDADRLAEQMRALASNPRDVNALIAAGELSLGLDDLSGAASLFARAEQVAPGNPRIKAGEGSILVRSERPGEALRYFAQAEAAGLDPRNYAADRGLAYDLIGQQERAQRDYRLALKTAPSDETLKRYALSLGISGKRDAALEQLDPLLRKQDRSAWRVRAFVLAMGGDQSGAAKIASTMLPGGMAQGLQPFFERLPTLPAADRAFAVHFGEVRTTPERIADARLAPALPYLAPEAAPVALAAVQPAAPSSRAASRSERRRRGRDREQPGRVTLASNSPTPATTPSYAEVTRALTQVQPVPASGGSITRAATMAPVAPVAVAAQPTVQPLPPTRTPVPTTTPSAPVTRPPVEVVTIAPAPRPTTVVASPPPPVALATATPSQPVVARSMPAPGFTTAASAALPTASVPTSTSAPAVEYASASPPVPAPVSPVASPVVTTTPTRTAFVAPAPTRRREQADSVLARIVAGLSIPGSELGVAEPPRPAPLVAAPVAAVASSPAAVATPSPERVLAEAKAKEQRDAEAEKALAAKAAADKRAADRKAAAEKKALAAKKAAEAEKLAEAKAAAEEKKKARANPSRIWVQVAGGANEDDLPKAWAAAKAKAPILAGKSGWKTPLRATNRVLTGPFKTDAEARAFVNQLTKQGVGAFAFTSDAGQVVEKLSSK
ncbi:SPOR domain-containing protein [Sphingomonas sp. MA1305]|uniref:tetratricopeptide repeat protein n=1 Tax=Sphingomonas sp. MA1305 TaxID=2479204 RepID=UPI0018DF958D|nr:tetratricopeptide repeat protein [Sphingomonas sp. MA1305]MBI0476560.1 SPOR domain-containing protein [Sphingomonas sp. MA1305]